MLSIPRDTVVSVAGSTSEIGKYNRINATYNTGPDQLVQTIEANFGIPIEHVVQLNFIGFRGAVDAIGGVDLDFPFPAKDTYTGLNITTAGCQHLNGGYSLAVARSRHYQYYENGYWQYDGTSDFGRIQRQNAFLKALINQAEKQYNPLTLNAFIGSVVQGVTIDSTFTIKRPGLPRPGVPLVLVEQPGHPDAADVLVQFVGVRLPGIGALRPAAPGRPGDRPSSSEARHRSR